MKYQPAQPTLEELVDLLPPTMEEVQRSWAERQRAGSHTPGLPPLGPPCFNRPDWRGPYAVQWRKGCPHWYPGGNAHNQSGLHVNGAWVSWSMCDGCVQKKIAEEAGEK